MQPARTALEHEVNGPVQQLLPLDHFAADPARSDRHGGMVADTVGGEDRAVPCSRETRAPIECVGWRESDASGERQNGRGNG